MILALVLAQVASSTTNCTPMPGSVSCTTQYQQAPQPMAPQPFSLGSGINRSAIAAAAEQGNAIDHAYMQIGDLIAAGQCDRAKQLATFYGIKRLVASTAKACP